MTSLYVLYDSPELNLRVRPATPVAELIRRAVHRLKAWNAVRATRRQLNALPDKMLADLGIERAAIETVARGLARR